MPGALDSSTNELDSVGEDAADQFQRNTAGMMRQSSSSCFFYLKRLGIKQFLQIIIPR